MGKGKRSILVVDDELEIAEALAALLAPYGKVRVATSGVQALEIVRSVPVDVAVVDYQMPGMDGVEVIRRIRSEYALIRIILVSGSPNRAFLEAAAGGNLSSFIAKPMDKGELQAGVKAALHELTQLEDDLRQAERRMLSMMPTEPDAGSCVHLQRRGTLIEGIRWMSRRLKQIPKDCNCNIAALRFRAS